MTGQDIYLVFKNGICSARDRTVQTPGELSRSVPRTSEGPEVWTLEYRVPWMMHRALSDDAQLDRLDPDPQIIDQTDH